MECQMNQSLTCNVYNKVLKPKTDLKSNKNTHSEKKGIGVNSVIKHSVTLTLLRSAFKPTVEKILTVVSNASTHAQYLIAIKHTCLYVLEGHFTTVSNVLTPAQHPITSEHTCLNTL